MYDRLDSEQSTGCSRYNKFFTASKTGNFFPNPNRRFFSCFLEANRDSCALAERQWHLIRIEREREPVGSAQKISEVKERGIFEENVYERAFLFTTIEAWVAALGNVGSSVFVLARAVHVRTA